MVKKFGVILAFLLFVLPSFSISEKEFAKHLTVYKLDNGLTFLLYERHDAPVVSFHTYVDVGSVNETYGITGISHMLEHMAFKGTTTIGAKDLKKELKLLNEIDKLFEKLYYLEDNNGSKQEIAKLKKEIAKLQKEAEAAANIGEFDRIVTEAGSPDLNAFTAADATQYHYSLPSNKIELFCFLESDRFMNPVFRQFYKERNVVAEERRMRVESNPFGKLLEEFQCLCYKYHPYQIPTIGAMSDIQRYTREKVENYFKKYYGPQTMTIAIVGDFDTEKIKPMLKEYFGRLPVGEKPAKIVTKEPEQTAVRKVVLKEKSQPVYLVGYHRPSARDRKADVAFKAIAQILGNGRTSRLYERLVKKERKAAYVGCFNGWPGDKYPSMFLIYAIPTPGTSLDDIAKEIDEEIERLKTEPIKQEELKKVKSQAKADLIYSLDSNPGIAMLLTNYYVKLGDWREIFREVDMIERLTPKDIQDYAKKYLRANGKNIGEIIPDFK